MKERILRGNLYLGSAILVGATILLALGWSFMQTWFYMFAWWPFILIVDSLNFRKSGISPLFESTGKFTYMLFVSVGVWLSFELFNLRLQNWSYHGIPIQTWQRWLGYFVAFASVIPAIIELSVFFQNALQIKKFSLFQLKNTHSFRKFCIFLGIVCGLLPLIWPRIFFPLVWLCFFFLLEPLNHRLGNDCFLKDLEDKDWSRFWSWVLAGLTAGILWEFFNFWAGSHWEYSLPYLNFGRIFQMPVFGYFGFIPFALEVFVLYTVFVYVYEKYLSSRVHRQVYWLCSALVIYMFVFYLIDKYSLVT